MYPVARYSFLTRQWEADIRRQQDPAELQAWAHDLLAAHGNPDSIRIVTNNPPSGIPRSPYGPRVALMNGASSGGSEDYVQLGWGGGHLHLWGMKIGDTNFVCGALNRWKPGICFFGSP